MKTRKIIALFLILAACFSLTACTTAGDNVSKFFSQVNRKVSIWTGSDSSSNSTSDSSKTALATAVNFTVQNDGSFSFDAVDGADSYIIYMYDAETGDGKYASASIEAASGTISGNLKDYGDYGYGSYNVELIAYPAFGDKEYKKSSPATAEISVSGAVTEPQIAYRWDCFEGTFGVELVNIDEYAATAYPTHLTITLTNQADASDTVVFDWENVTPENDNFYGETSDITKDAVYDIQADASFSEAVSNNSLSVSVGTVTTSSKRSEISEGYGYTISGIYSYADFPTAADFDPANGGSVGTWYYFSEYSVSNKGMVTVASLDGDAIYFTAEPAEEVTEGSQYSYTVRMANADGVIVSSGGMGGTSEMRPGIGTLELYADGSFLMSITGSEADPDADATATQQQGGGMNSGVSASEIQGIWEKNSDGTIHLSYDLSTAVSTAAPQAESDPVYMGGL